MGDTSAAETDVMKLANHTETSTYDELRSHVYDPEFITHINSKMQVPDRISVGGFDYNGRNTGSYRHEQHAATNFVDMSVPDRIVLAGDNHHIALRHDLDLDLSARSQIPAASLSYVGLITPPRTLTLEERFPVVEETDDQKILASHGGSKAHRDHTSSNGHVTGPVPYDPGVSLNDSLLLNEENEVTLLKTQVAKLSRRVQVIEEDHQKRLTRELFMYPLILGYFMWKMLGWLSRDR